MRGIAEDQIDQQEHDDDRHRHHEVHACLGVLQGLELSGPVERVAGRQRHLLRHRVLEFGDRAAEIVAGRIDKHEGRRDAFLALHHRRPIGHMDVRYLPEGYLCSAGCHDRQRAECRDRVACSARVTQHDRESLQALDGLADGFTTDRCGNQRLDVLLGEPVAASGVRTNLDPHIAPAIGALGDGRGDARYALRHAGDVGCETLQFAKVRPQYLDADR